MIIFNGDALIAILIAAIFVGPMYFFDFMEGSTETWIYGAAAFVIGGIVEMSGMKPRLFYIPVWLIGLGLLIYLGFDSFGWLGMGVAVGVLVGIFVLLGVVGYKAEKKEWRDAPQAFEDAKVALLNDDRILLWQRLNDAFFVPGILNMKPAMAEHDLRVMGFVLQHGIPDLPLEAAEQAQALEKYLQSYVQAEKKFDLKLGKLTEFKEHLVVAAGEEESSLRPEAKDAEAENLS